MVLILFQMSLSLVWAENVKKTPVHANEITLDEAVHRVKNNNQGKVLDAKTVHKNGEPVHVIKVLTNDGRVKKIRVKSKPPK